MPPFALIFKFAIFFICRAMAFLSPRDAIHIDDLERYDAFMKTMAGTQYLHLYPGNQVIKLDVYEYPSDELVKSGEFKRSAKADAYWEQEDEFEKEFLVRQECHNEDELEFKMM
ncbi:hypothetical protein RAB80_015030 [Fusarium oxysporum f. sp. vasinfectum]|jgi:hypothetical protein|uniref:Uncharacterized protein n=2 Tax=Fusarium oxysporum TaxID=5507 RepID=N4UMU5_FUSC1|nr:hypothetical protein FOC1_g10004115 [Fusarium oxysporum f. sp. cubense race 1]EXM19092.1 hypothetical protein FOTG_12878 [Fusarium oxysporum f. sp. vasinfectum 25433]KAK2669504.1 hypothetical protein RAB80_015030 [Fusarium oxysporum f. sp. vasinfectum]KAK2688874.1 hypothetical protein QWA68_012094 [Fusarium oxysporum]KAK2925063.1 hypothetical protein FoTM2_015342 [Fusarium oxysporum f. sp. vasinfectum]